MRVTAAEWQTIWDKLGKDIISILMDFEHGRKTAIETADTIAKYGQLCVNLGAKKARKAK